MSSFSQQKTPHHGKAPMTHHSFTYMPLYTERKLSL